METEIPRIKRKYLVTCYACVIRGQEILLVRQDRGYWKDLWVIPGGSLELGETLEDCARREVLEETNVQVQVLQQTGTYLSYDPDTSFEKQVICIAYLARPIGGQPSAASDAREVRWTDLGEVNALREVGKLPDLVARIVDDARIRAKEWWVR
ncbi:MAG: NUDIX domain-containing protein [Coprothermobacterota bacterium]|nr:NUDIX domain-containing protein [Coprothermobacterota bacterium]